MTEPNNTVHLTGRMSADPESKVLPSGDEVLTFRLVVRRGPSARRRSKQVVDTIECSVWSAPLRRKVARWPAGTEMTVEGQLRRRFTRGGAGVVSFVTVDVDSCARKRGAPVASEA